MSYSNYLLDHIKVFASHSNFTAVTYIESLMKTLFDPVFTEHQVFVEDDPAAELEWNIRIKVMVSICDWYLP